MQADVEGTAHQPAVLLDARGRGSPGGTEA